MSRILVAIFAMVLCSPALAAPAAKMEAPEDALVDDRGDTLCAQYLEVRRNDPQADKLFWSYALGLMGGLNMGRLISGQDVRAVGSRNGLPEAVRFGTLTATMVQYCELHPADGYGFGIVWRIYRNLPLVPGSQQDWQRRRGG
jgi:hypothetical protein